MARMIDPSELEGDDLANWYQRSPAEVDAEREAVRQEQYDAFVKSIGAASELQGDSAAQPPGPAQGAAQRSSDNWRGGEIGSSDGDTGLVEARYFQPFAPPVMAPPSGLRFGPSLDARGSPPIGASASGFFGRHDYSDALQGYYTDQPSPLNIVTATPAGWWEIGDGRRVQTDEVERIYAEQQRRLKGQDGTEPPARVRVVDKWKDGQVPLASQVEKDERELDPTCAPNGGWERDPNFRSYSGRTKRYETQVTHAPGLDYVVRNPGQRPVKFDGCAVWDPRHPLLEAKGPGYAPLLPKALEWGFYGNMLRGAVSQADRQAEAAPNQRIEWHVAEPGAYAFFKDATWPDRPPIVLRQTPAR
jgi:Restriction endonuclease fold toxin 5